MEASLEARLRALEDELAQLRREVAAPATGDGEPAAATPAPVSRRHLLWAGGAAAAGAAGMALASPSPAGAQTGPPASSVTFSPTGGISATNVQAALVEVDGEKAGLALNNSFSGAQTFLDARLLMNPMIDVRAYGAGLNPAEDDAPKIQAAIDAALGFFGHKGVVYMPPGKYNLGSLVTVKPNVDLWGGGGHGQNDTVSGTVLVASGPGGRLEFQGEGGQSGNFAVRGNGVANPPNGLVYLGPNVVERAFTALRVTGSLADGMVIESAQNCSFTQLMVAQHGQDGLVLDKGTGGHAFVRCEFGACVHDGVAIRETLGTGPYPTPQHNLFLHSIFERASGPGFTGPSRTQLSVTAGKNNKFSHCIFSRQTDPPDPANGPFFLVKCTQPVPSVISSTTFDGCIFTAKTDGAKIVHGLLNDGAGVFLSGFSLFKTPIALQWDNNAYGETTGNIRYESGVTTRVTGSGQWQNKVVGSNFPFAAFVEPAANFGMRVQQVTDTGYRFNVSRDGEISVSDGTTFSPKARWKLQADGSGWETPDEVFLNGGVLAVQEIGTTPPAPPAGNRAVMYVKSDRLVVAFNDAGTVRYRSMLLTGTAATWIQSTTPP